MTLAQMPASFLLRSSEALLELPGHVFVELLFVLEDVPLPDINPLVLAQPDLLGHLPSNRLNLVHKITDFCSLAKELRAESYSQ